MSGGGRPVELPAEVDAVLRGFRTCELSTLARDGTPVTWPVVAFWRPDEGRFVVGTSIGLPQKAFNVRRDPRVSLLFSDPTACGLADPPAVQVQGDAEAPDQVVTSVAGFEDDLRELFRRQPPARTNPVIRHLFDWYSMRLLISVSPRRVSWWPRADLEQQPLRWDAA